MSETHAPYGRLRLAPYRFEPRRVARCVPGGAEGPDHTYKLPSTVQRQMEHIGALWAEHAVWKKRLPDFVSTVRDVLQRFSRDPVSIDLPASAGAGVTSLAIGRFDVEYATAAGLADTRLLSLLPAWYDGMARGDFGLPARTSALVTRAA